MSFVVNIVLIIALSLIAIIGLIVFANKGKSSKKHDEILTNLKEIKELLVTKEK